MPYIYEISFDIDPGKMSGLHIGGNLERVIGYLRTMLPTMPGYVMSRGMYSLDIPEKTHIILMTVWMTWADLDEHRRSRLSETQALAQFGHIKPEDMTVHMYQEIE